jgi:hypothetical protein
LEQKEARWAACDSASKDQVRHGLLQSLISPCKDASHTSAQVIAAFGAVDVQAKEWKDLLPTLLQFVSSEEAPEMAKVSSLEVSKFYGFDDNVHVFHIMNLFLSLK